MDTNLPGSIPQLSTMILAVGALGTAAFGLVDAFKALPGGGVSHFGFKFVRNTVKQLIPDGTTTGLSRDKILESLKSQWINGTASVADQVNIAKSLIKLQLSAESATVLAKATGVDADTLKQVANCMKNATPLSTVQSDVNGRFDLALTTLLDQAYRRGEQRYRNAAKSAAVVVAVVLSVVTNQSLGASAASHATPISFWQAVLLGLIATPIAPVAKDIASAVQTASKAIQAWKG